MATVSPEISGAPLFTKDEWDAHAAHVTREMQEFTKPFVTPISKVIDDDYGEAWGTGNYIELDKRPHMVTNDHVARALESNSLGHQFMGNDSVYRATQPFHSFDVPFDVAVSEVEGRIWNDRPHNSAVIPEDKWALAHLPLERELLFVKGFAGADARFLFGALFSQATSYTCQEVKLPSDPRFHSRFHFGLDYRPDLAKRLDERDLPIPRGFSGSLVWNTRFVETHLRKETWTPDSAQVTGLVWGWPSSAAFLVATRAEYVRSFLLRVLEQ